VAWIIFCAALVLHVTDEALTGFLPVYNRTILAIRPPGWRFPFIFEFQTWLTLLLAGIALLFTLSPLFWRGVNWVRALASILAVLVGILNALAHITGTILGHTVASVRVPRPMPGFYSSPFLLLASGYLLFRVAQSRRDKRVEQTPRACVSSSAKN
jgi:hypothetical protein